MRSLILLLLVTLAVPPCVARNDFWLGCDYTVGLRFSANDLGRINAPRPKKVALPAFPADMMTASVGGTVVLEYLVEENGAVASLHIVEASARLFETVSVAAARNWSFEPAVDLKTGRPTAATMRCTIRFVVDDR